MQPQSHPTAKMTVNVLDDLILAIGVRGPGSEVIGWLEQQVLAVPASGHTAFMQVILPSTSTNPSVADSSRRAMVHFAQACQPRLQGAAFVLLLDGFLGATVRSVLAAATMAAQPKIPVKIFGTVAEGLAWLGKMTPARLPALAQVTEQVTRTASSMGVKPGG